MLKSQFRELIYRYQADNPDRRMTFAAMAELFGVPVWFLQALWHDRVQRLNLEYADQVCIVLGIDLGDLFVSDYWERVAEAIAHDREADHGSN